MSRKKAKADRTGECAGCGKKRWWQNVPLKLCTACNKARKQGEDQDLAKLKRAEIKRAEKAEKPGASNYAKENTTPEADDERTQLYRKVWPKGKPMPKFYRPARKYPCPSCERILTDYASQAVMLLGLKEHVAYFSCRCCGEGFSLPVRRDED